MCSVSSTTEATELSPVSPQRDSHTITFAAKVLRQALKLLDVIGFTLLYTNPYIHFH